MTSARMIAPVTPSEAAPLLRHEFLIEGGHGPIERATLRLSALGVIEAWVGGVPSSDELLAPGWTSYEWRTRVVEHDVTSALAAGAERAVVGLRLGNGWYRGWLGFTGQRAVYGDERAGLAELEIRFADGAVQRIVTDESWRAGTGEVLADDLYNGQTIDARLAGDPWLLPGFDDATWGSVRTVEFDDATLVERTSPPVRRVGERAVERIWTSPAGKTLVDFGQNLVGFLRVRVSGPEGAEIVIRHAEVIEEGELGTRPLRRAEATDRFILSGGDDVFEPALTFHGFRYAEVTGWPGSLDDDPSALTAVVVASDIAATGSFSCSDPLLTQLHRNVEWGMRGNFLSVPTDCPQRDERLGWTGDLAVFAPTAAFLGDVESFLSDWLVDAELERRATPAQTVPVVVPNVMKYLDTGFPEPGATAVWGDAAVWVPWALWMAYGNEQTLRDAYPLMTAHTRAVAGSLSAEGLWDTGFQFGDWLDPDAPADDPGQSKTPAGVVATASAYRTATLMAQTSALLGQDADAGEFTALQNRIGDAFRNRYVVDGIVHGDSATGHALALGFDLLAAADRRRAGDRLAELVREAGHRISTGFVGTPFVCDALASTGHLDDAYALLMQRETPSWLYAVTMGATTIWERWDSMLPDGTINPGEMTSFNHYAFGAIADWMHRSVGGLAPLEPGYRRLLIAPLPGGGLTWAETSLETRHGRAAVRWELDGGMLRVDAVVPEGTEAVLRLPGVDDETVGPGSHTRLVREASGARVADSLGAAAGHRVAPAEGRVGYANPIVRGHAPDPSVIRVGADYFMVNSSFDMMPGLPIRHSRDLVDWRIIGHAVTRPGQYRRDGEPGHLELFAPTIRHHDGRFFVVCTNPHAGQGNFFVTTDDPFGSWSDAVWLDDVAFDPSLFRDDDGVWYYSRRSLEFGRPDGNLGPIVQAEIDVDSGDLGEFRAVTPGADGFVTNDIEGPHLFRRGEWYYLTGAEGSSWKGHLQSIGRSRSPWGPFEPAPHNPIVTHRGRVGHPIQSLGHVDFFDAPDGSWWAVALGTRHAPLSQHHNIGRETFLLPVRWSDDGWPIVGDAGATELWVDEELPPADSGTVPAVEDSLWTRGWMTRGAAHAALDASSTDQRIELPAGADLHEKTRPQGALLRRQTADDQRFSVTLVGADGDGVAGVAVVTDRRHHYSALVEGRGDARVVRLRRQVDDLRVDAVVAVPGDGPVGLAIEARPGEYSFSIDLGAGHVRIGAGAARLLSAEAAEWFVSASFALVHVGDEGKALFTDARLDDLAPHPPVIVPPFAADL